MPMTEPMLDHPGDDTLRALSLGQLSEVELIHVSGHLNNCPACCGRIDQLATDDPLLRRLQQSADSREKMLVSPAQRSSAVRALRQLEEGRAVARERGWDVGSAPLSAVYTHPGPSPSQSPPEEMTRFLAPPEQPDEIGRLGPYRVLSILGHGGMGVVFRAHDPALDRVVALKVMLPSMAALPNAKERFLREAKAAAALKHPHVVTVFQVGEDRGAPFLAMEFLEGESLDNRIRREGRLPLAEVLRIGIETALALAVAHSLGLVHRDIKPANLWLEGPNGRVKVLDFGLAQDRTDQVRLTQHGLVIGTPAYMAPEQAEGKPVDPRSDLFSLGCVLYQMSTGSLPYQGESTIAVLRALALHEPQPLCEVRPEVPMGLSALVVGLLAKKSEDRLASAQVVVDTLLALDPFPTTQFLPTLGTGPVQKGQPTSGELASSAPAPIVAMALKRVLWPTPRGVVVIESDAPEVEIVFEKDGPTIKGADTEPIVLRAEDHAILIRRGDFTFEADKLVLKRGPSLLLKVEWLQS